MKKIEIQPVSRIEGHGKVTIFLDDEGNVKDTHTNVVELRGFERFAIGRPVEEMPRITTAICGVCPWSHHLASSKATDGVFDAPPPRPASLLRELGNSAAYIEEHILHFYFLAGADFVLGPDADYRERNVFGIVKALPDVARRVVRARHLAGLMVEIIGGKAIHPIAGAPGGFTKPLTKDERKKLRTMGAECLELARLSLKIAREELFPKNMDAIRSIGVIRTGYLGTVKGNGDLNLYDGKLRLMDPDGGTTDFPYEDYDKHIREHIEPWSYLKFPYIKEWGGFSMDLDEPKGIYRTNTLARLNVCDDVPTPQAHDEFKEYRAQFGRPTHVTLLYNYARLIELLYNAEHVMELLDDPDLLSRDIRNQPKVQAGRGIGCVEAPRGTLIHDYEGDENGLIKACNLIVGTTHNNAAINMSVKRTAMDLIKDGQYDEGVINRIEMAIRAYDPCLSCATHDLDGRIRLHLDIVDNDGRKVRSLKN